MLEIDEDISNVLQIVRILIMFEDTSSYYWCFVQLEIAMMRRCISSQFQYPLSTIHSTPPRQSPTSLLLQCCGCLSVTHLFQSDSIFERDVGI